MAYARNKNCFPMETFWCKDVMSESVRNFCMYFSPCICSETYLKNFLLGNSWSTEVTLARAKKYKFFSHKNFTPPIYREWEFEPIHYLVWVMGVLPKDKATGACR
jgi:predicted transglutaminase-like protease